MAQSAARTTSPVGHDRAGDTAVGLTQRDERGAEVDRIGRDIEGVHPVANSIRPPLPEKLSDLAQPRILGRIQSVSPENDRLDHLPGPKLFDRAAHPGVLALTKDHPGLPSGGPVDQLGPKAHERNRRAKALATAGCTSGAHVTTESRDFANQAGAEIGEIHRRDQEDSFQ